MVLREGHTVAANFGSAAPSSRSASSASASPSARTSTHSRSPGPSRGSPLPRRVPRRPGPGPGGPSHRRQLVLSRRARSRDRHGPMERRSAVGGARAHGVVTGAAVGCTDRSDSATALTLVGPRAARLLDDAGLEPDLPVGGVRESWFAGSSALVVREAADRFLLVLDADRAVDAWQSSRRGPRPGPVDGRRRGAGAPGGRAGVSDPDRSQPRVGRGEAGSDRRLRAPTGASRGRSPSSAA